MYSKTHQIKSNQIKRYNFLGDFVIFASSWTSSNH